MTIALTPDLERLLAEAARQHGTTPERLALEYLRERLIPVDTAEPAEVGTLKEFLAPFIGIVDSSEHIPGGAQLSQQAGRRFTEGLLKRREQGRL